MADSKIQIAVEVVGGKEAQAELKRIERATTSISNEAKKSGKQVENLGESFKEVGKEVESSNKQTVRGVQAVSGGLGSANESAVTLGRAMVTLADNGSRGMIAILGPIGAVAATLYTLYEAYQEITGAAKEYEKTTAVATAVASDLTSKLDALATKSIRLTSDEMRGMITSIFDARMGIEYMNEQIGESQKIFSDRIQAQRELNIILGKEKDLIDQNMWFFSRWAASIVKGITIFTDFRTQQEKLKDAQDAVNKVTKEQEEYVRELTKAYQEKYEASVKEEQAQIRRETTLSEALDMLEAEYTAQSELNALMIEAYGTGSAEEKAIQIKQLQVGVSEELAKARKKDRLAIYDEAQSLKELNLQNKINLEADAKAIKQKKELSELEKKLAENRKKQSEIKSITPAPIKTVISKPDTTFIDTLNREVTLLNRNLQDQKDVLTDYGFQFQNTFRKNIDIISDFSNNLLQLQQGQKKAFTPEKIKQAGLDPQQFYKEVEERLKASQQIIVDKTKETYDSLVDIEEKKIEVLLDIRNKEIDNLEVSEKKKQILRKQALDDSLYTTKRNNEITKNALQDEVNNAIQKLATKNYEQKQAELESLKITKTSEIEKKKLQDEIFKGEMEWRTGLELLNAESNQTLLEKENDTLDLIYRSEKEVRVKEINDLKEYLQLREDILSTFNIRYTDEYKKQQQEEIDTLKQQIAEKEILNKEAFNSYIVNMTNRANKTREIDLELKNTQKRYERDLTSFFLDNEQIKQNGTIEFYENFRDKQKEQFNKSIKNIDEEANLLETRISELSLKLSQIDPKDTIKTDKIFDELESKKSEQEEIEKIKKDTLQREEFARREHNDRMYQYDLEHYQAVGGLIKDFSATSSQALIDSGVAAAFAGEKIGDALRTTLRGLAQEATARALFEGAAAFGSYAIGDARGAALHGKSAVAFALAATTMGLFSAAVGVPGGGGGASTSTSPTATPQATATEARPEARETQPIVYNINFGGSVIYDTREAAMRAFSNEITQIQSRAVRGTQSARMMNRG